ncbi:MAG: hypothetical protein AB1468_04605 [Candidatus Micrarchaeota archaeon]
MNMSAPLESKKSSESNERILSTNKFTGRRGLIASISKEIFNSFEQFYCTTIKEQSKRARSYFEEKRKKNPEEKDTYFELQQWATLYSAAVESVRYRAEELESNGNLNEAAAVYKWEARLCRLEALTWGKCAEAAEKRDIYSPARILEVDMYEKAATARDNQSAILKKLGYDKGADWAHGQAEQAWNFAQELREKRNVRYVKMQIEY